MSVWVGGWEGGLQVLVIDGSTGEFEAGLGAGGQTAEHAVLVRRCACS